MRPIELRSDNSAGVPDPILDAIHSANAGSAMAYGADEVTALLEARVREVCEHPTARVFPVTSGTAGNALGLSSLTPPWGAVMCHEPAHILNAEATATSLLSSGAQMIGLAGDDHQLAVDSLRAVLDGAGWDDPHHTQPAVLSFTQPTDMGTVYPIEVISELCSVARASGLRAHLDGARLANAISSLGCAPADVTWRAGIDVFTLGATKNGAMSAEAIVSFDDAASKELVYRTKRSGHVTSKLRFQSAQIEAYLTDGLWLRLAANSNAMMRRLADGLAALDVEVANRGDANMAFLRRPDEVIDRLDADDLLFYRIAPGVIRFVTSWQTTVDDVDAALDRMSKALHHETATPARAVDPVPAAGR